MADQDLTWRIEQACFNAWPALNQIHIGDWAAREGGGLTRRINSANPLSAGAGPPVLERPAIEEVYRRWGLRPRFRIPSFLDSRIDVALEQAGYEFEADTLTLYADLDRVAAAKDADVEIEPAPSEAWLAAKAELSAFTPDQSAVYRSVLERLSLPGAFVALRRDGRIVSQAYAAVQDGLLCLEGVVTDEHERGRGFAQRILRALFHWARERGAVGVCLQVEAGNAPAVALYPSLGVAMELYRYHYWSAPGS